MIGNAVKTYYNGEFYVRVPLRNSRGYIYFKKEDKLNAVFFRINPDSGNRVNVNRFSGTYEVIDFENLDMGQAVIKNGFIVRWTKGSLNGSVSDNNSLIKQEASSWFSQLLYCIGKHLFALPAKVGNEWAGCWVLGGSGGDENVGENQIPLPPEGGGPISWLTFFTNIYPPNDLNTDPNLPDFGGGSGAGGGINWSYFSQGQTDPIPSQYDEYVDYVDFSIEAAVFDNSIGFDEGGNSTNVDNDPIAIIDTSLPFPTVTDIIGKNNFVQRQSPSQNCLSLAKKQIAVLGYKSGGYDPGGQTYSIYKRNTGINKTVAIQGVSYIIDALQKNKPVIVGVDYGGVSPNLDGTTNHFVVIVGMGSDSQGNYFWFYDNITSNIIFGTAPSNKLYFNPSTGALTGYFVGTPSIPPLFYKVSQIRKSVL